VTTATLPVMVIRYEPERSAAPLRAALLDLNAPILCGFDCLVWRESPIDLAALRDAYQIKWRAEKLGVRFIDEGGKEAKPSYVNAALKCFLTLAQSQRWFSEWDPKSKEVLHG